MNFRMIQAMIKCFERSIEINSRENGGEFERHLPLFM